MCLQQKTSTGSDTEQTGMLLETPELFEEFLFLNKYWLIDTQCVPKFLSDEVPESWSLSR